MTTNTNSNRKVPMLSTKMAGIVAALGLVLASTAAFAQVGTTGSITGTVLDKDSEKPLAGVTVIAVGAQGEEAALTDESGTYNLTGLTIGTYTVRFFLANSNVKVEQQNVIVSVDKTVRVNARMPASAQTEEAYTITEKAPAIDVSSTRVGTTITKDYTDNVPTGRQFGDVLQKAPGAFNDPTGVSLGGATGLESTYVMDGVNITSIGFGSLGSNLVNDFVQETEVITGGYNAEYGRALGGVVNVVTKSGTNDFHGSVFGYWSPGFLAGTKKLAYSRSTSLAARTVPGNDFNLGLEVGGPIIKNKLFFWVGYSPTIGRSKMERIGVQMQDTDMDGLPDGRDGNGDGVPDKPDSNGDGVPDTVVPLAPGQQLFSEKYDNKTNVHQVTTKVTYVPSANHSLSVGYYGSFSSFEGPRGGNGDIRSEFTKDTTNSNDVSGRWVSKLMDRKWQLEVNGSIHAEKTDNESPYSDMNALNMIVWQNAPSLGQFNPAYPNDSGPCARRAATMTTPGFDPCPVQNYLSGGYDLMQFTTANRYAGGIKNTHLIRAGGQHQIKWGAEAELNQYDDKRGYSGPDGGRARNYILYAPTGNGFGGNGQLLPPIFFAYSRNHFTYPKGRRAYEFTDVGDDGNEDPDMNGKLSDLAGPDFYRDFIHAKTETNYYSYFVQDGYSILPNLTLNVGFRWEAARINDFAGSPAIKLGGNPFDFSDMFSPRIGLIYDPTNEGRSKLFASYGRFYENIPMDINNRAFGGEGLLFTFYDDESYCQSPIDQWQSGDPQKGWRSCNKEYTDSMGNMIDGRVPSTFDYYSPSGGENALVQRDLKGQYSDEILVGGQYELFEDFTVGVSYLNRKLGRIIEDASGDGTAHYVLSNPGDIPDSLIKDLEKEATDAEARAMMDPTPANRAAAGDAAAMYENLKVIQGFPKAKRDYNALQLTAMKRFSKNWLMQASYTYARTVGNYTGLFAADNGQSDPNITSQYDLAELLLNRDGPLPNDRPHIGRLDGYYTVPVSGSGGVIAGLGFVARSGVPLNYQGRHVTYGRRETFILPRGAGGRTPMITQFDGHVGWRQRLSDGMTLDAFVDIFNLFNQEEILNQDSEYTVQRVNAIVDGDESDLKHLKQTNNAPVTVNPNYKNATSFQAPISGRFGLRLSF